MFPKYCLTKVRTAFKSQYRCYSPLFSKKRLLFINSITSGGCMAIGDLAQQEFEYQAEILPKRYNWARCWRMFAVGMCLGPLHHYYYVYLDKMLPKVNARNVLSKVMADQLFASPLTIVSFFFLMGILEQKTLKESYDEIAKKMKYVYLGDCLFWPPVQIINFYYLPTHYRVVYINVATMVFNVFMSYMKHYDQ